MPKRDEFAFVSLDVSAGSDAIPAQERSETPFRILLLGDFSGRRERGPVGSRRLEPIPIDRDDFDEVLAGMGVEAHAGGIKLAVRSIDDFHPDRIFENVAAFRALREMRGKPSKPPALTPSGGSLLDSVVEAMEFSAPTAARSQDPLKSFVQQVVAPHVLPREDAQLAERKARMDEVAGELMRAILHDEGFQALEAAWRAVRFLVQGLETNELLKVYLLDITRAELDEGFRLPGAEPWAVVAGNFAFGQTEGDIETLRRLAGLMRAAGAPFLAEASPAEDGSPGWNSLRSSAGAAWLGLALPRFLLRLPYGAETEPIDSFRFEEMPGTPVHQEYLWGNPAFACAYLLGQAFSSHGWDMRPGADEEVEGLPLHVYEDGGERKLKSCAEVEMSESDAEWALDQGYMPLLWVKGQSSVCLLRFQSIADPVTRLSGRWNQRGS